MDVITEAVEDLRIGQAYGRRALVGPSFAGRFEAMDGVGFHAVLRGGGWLITADGGAVELGPGDIAVIPNGAVHGFGPEPCRLDEMQPAPMGLQDVPDDPVTLDFLCGVYRLERGGSIHHYLRSLPDVLVVSPDAARHGTLHALVTLLADELSVPRAGNEVTRPALVDLLLVHSLRLWHEQHPAPEWGALGDPGIAAVLREIHDSPQAQWTVDRLSRRAGMSRTAFTRRFTSLVGAPPMTYLIGRRLHQGAQLLRETDAPLSAIARQIGYATEFAFAGAFRREFGISPGRFRQATVPLLK